MNFRRLEYFSVLASVGNVNKAAELLHVSAPALSKAMKVLEEELEQSLWQRNGRNIMLTDAGKLLQKKISSLIDDVKDLREIFHKEETSTLKIGTFEVFSTYFLTYLNQMDWKNISLELHELLPGEVEKYCKQGDIDFGITYMPVPDPDLDFLKVSSIEMGVFTRKGALKGTPQEELPFVVPVNPLQGTPTKVRGLDGWPENAYRRKVLHKVTLMESALELCRQGKVAGYFPVFIVQEHNNRVKADLQLERRKSPYAGRVCYSDVFLVKRKSTEENEISKRLARALRSVKSNPA